MNYKRKIMCGVFGFITESHIEFDKLKQMTDLLSHRGPDDSGYIIKQLDSLNIGLGHRRLAIIDLDKRSSQPFFNSSREIAIVYNGEVYNYLELKKDLKNFMFRTTSDTEVILAMYETYGITFVNKLVGIFSFVIVDFKKNKTLMVRDRHGVKPLYYFLNQDHLVFSSELRPIMNYPHFLKEINSLSLEFILSLGFIPSIYTIFKDVYKVRPGSILIFEGNKQKEELVYWDNIEEYLKTKKSNPPLEYYKKEVHEAIKRNLVSDVEVVTFLSGGIDSSLVTSIASEYTKQLQSYTIGFESIEIDETFYANRISEQLNVKNHIEKVSLDDMVEVALNIAEIYDEPFADSSQLPTYILSNTIQKDGKKVALSGDGGDEFFYGYKLYDGAMKRHIKFLKISRISKILFPVTNYLKNSLTCYGISLFSDIKLFYYGLYSGYSGYYSRKVLLSKNNFELIKGVFSFLDKIKCLTPIEINSLFDQKIYLIDDILVKADRASMANSLELRVPLLDHPLSLAAYKTNAECHFDGVTQKIILKDLLKEYVEDDFINREKKGFSIPLVELLRNEKINLRIRYFTSKSFLDSQNLFSEKQLNTILRLFYLKDDHKTSNFLWHFFVFQSWYEKHIL